MLNIDWGLLQLQYEMFHATADELAEEYGTTPRMIDYYAQERGWVRSPLAVVAQDYSKVDPSDKDSISSSIQENTRLLHSLKQSTLNPRYVALEAAILGKCLALVKNLETDNPLTATALKSVSDILKSLKEVQSGKSGAESQEREGFKLIVMNQIGTKSEDSREAVAIEYNQPPGGSASTA